MSDLVCSIQALIACFSWSNFYLDAGLSWQSRGDLRVTQIGTYDPDFSDRVHQAVPYYFGTYEAQNPYADASIGYAISPAPNLEISLSVAGHKSSIATGKDWGFNYARLGFRWRPFKNH